MVSGTLVENQLDAGRRLLDQLDKQGVVVRAACWVRPFEDDRWTLYIATPSADEERILEAYRQVTPALRSLGDEWITSSDVTVVGAKHPLVKDALDILRRFPHRAPIRLPRSLLGGISAEEVYIYPLGKTPVTIYGLIFRGEPSGALHLSLEPHDSHSTLTVESMGKRNVYPAETGIDWVVAAPEGAKLERDEIGRMVLAWNNLHGNRMQSSANEVWSLAKLGLHGFRFLREPA
ncbi:MAG: hypothetical protein L0Z62_22815 [Gemmataceae bacterium]|nr:hypothetical protein [Gemmataceae bacterium]